MNRQTFRAVRRVPSIVSRHTVVHRLLHAALRMFLVFAVVSANASLTSAQEGTPPLRIDSEHLRPNVLLFSGYTNGNVLVVMSDTGLLLVDAQSAKRVAALDSAIRRVSTLPVRTVINSHYHADHTEGNAYYRERGATIVAQRNVRRQAVKDTVITEWDNWHREALPDAALPAVLYDDSLHLTIGSEPVAIYHVPNAHTDGDSFVWLTRVNVLHTGDILEMNGPPFIDFWVGGSLAGMIAGIDRAIAISNDSTTIVPGHGRTSSRDDLRRYRAMLLDLQQQVKDAVARGMTLDAFIASRPTERYAAAFEGVRREQYFLRQIYYGEQFARSHQTPR